MNTINTEKSVISKTIKDTAIALTISIASIFSITASAQAASTIETAISEFVVAQGQQVMSQLNDQLQLTIANEVKEFSFNSSAVEVKPQANKKVSNDEQVVIKTKSNNK